jgi:tRNA uridine 5-carboxymethylaminomethyl modification enzyme
VRASLALSPLHSGAIEGRGPRYCPSIEDKIARFGDRDGHQIFLEPEQLDHHWIYPNGISTSLPADVQHRFINSIAGLERAEIAQPGYAVEYDYVDPRALSSSLALRATPGLFCAGQINGTTGYEEAAAQGLVAGLAAAAHALDRPPVIFARTDSYIGVMIDDLTLQGVTEPYRMLTARAEYRLRLRTDNAVTRLGPLALGSGAIGEERRRAVTQRLAQAAEARVLLEQSVPGTAMRLADRVRRDEPSVATLREWAEAELPDEVLEEAIHDARYAPYLERQAQEIARLAAGADTSLRTVDSYAAVAGLSQEMVERLEAARPETLAAAARIRGITPAALSAILVAAHRRAA